MIYILLSFISYVSIFINLNYLIYYNYDNKIKQIKRINYINNICKKLKLSIININIDIQEYSRIFKEYLRNL